ncbi:MAG: saccharopine dehydrogenase family protein, partial [Mesorhizobium sp.]
AIAPVLANVLAGVDAAIDLLPQPLMREAVQAAIATRTPLVTTNYGKTIADLAPAAEAAGVSIMTECGLDPGIDLVLYARAARQFDAITAIDSYCGGIPEPKAMAKPLCYKVSWNFDMVLMSQNRDSVLVEDGQRVDVPAGRQHDNPFIHQIEVEGLGRLEAFPNGDAPHYAGMLAAAKG